MPRERYERFTMTYQESVRRFLIGGRHIHDGLGDPDSRESVCLVNPLLGRENVMAIRWDLPSGHHALALPCRRRNQTDYLTLAIARIRPSLGRVRGYFSPPRGRLGPARRRHDQGLVRHLTSET